MSTMFDEMGNVIFSDIGDVTQNLSDNKVVDSSSLSIDYFRNKVIEFQNSLISLDNTYRELYDMSAVAYASGDETAIAEYNGLIEAFEAKRGTFRVVAEALNLASQGINAVGVSFPTVQFPAGLGAGPLIPLAAAAGAIAAATALIVWAQEFWRAVREWVQRMQHLDAIQLLPENQRAPMLEKLRAMELSAQKAEAESNSSPLAALGSLVKWAAILGIVYVGWKAYEGNKHGNR